MFTPTAVSPETLLERTVGRSEVIERLVGSIAAAATSAARPHILVVGPRGSGKTHLLTLVVHRIASDEHVSARVAVASIPEDALAVASYEDLLVAVVEQLDGGSSDAARTLRADRDTGGLERLVETLLGERILLLVVENLNRVFGDLGGAGQSRLRSFTETSGRVLLLASTPLLFAGVSEHSRPWYGSFDVEHLHELDVEEGGELLRRVASARGDERLVAFLETDQAHARLRAVAHLAGGSPRMWMILASLQTVELIDELIPLVEAMLDELVPYYQQRLLELASTERRLIVELCRSDPERGPGGGRGMRTVGELARATGISERVVATALSRLHKARWVRREKARGGDARTTWYEVREPLLRHHLQYRETRGEPLRVIVAFLRSWYSFEEQRRHLALVQPGSLAELYLRHALADDVALHRSDAMFESRSVETTLAAARAALQRETAGSAVTATAATIVEAVVVAVRDGEDAGRAVLDRRLDDGGKVGEAAIHEAVAAGMRAVQHADDLSPAQTIDIALVTAADDAAALAPEDRIALAVVAAGRLRSAGAVADAQARLERLADDDALRALDVRLRLAIESERAKVLLAIGDRAGARELADRVAGERCAQLGPADADALASRALSERLLAEAGDDARARALAEARLRDCERALGRDHPETFEALDALATWTHAAGDPSTAARIFHDEVERATTCFGAGHPRTLMARLSRANAAIAAGPEWSDVDELVRLVEEVQATFGGDSLVAVTTRHVLASGLAACGRPDEARDLFALVADEWGQVAVPDAQLELPRAAALLAADQTEEAIAVLAALLPRLVVHSAREWALTLSARVLCRPPLMRAALLEDADARTVARFVLESELGSRLVIPWLSNVAQADDVQRAALVPAVVDLTTEVEALSTLVIALLVHAAGDATARSSARWLELWSREAERTPALAVALSGLEALWRADAGDDTMLLSLPAEIRELLDAARAQRASQEASRSATS